MSAHEPSVPARRPVGNYYFCAACEVYGLGTECWFCASELVQWGRRKDISPAADVLTPVEIVR